MGLSSKNLVNFCLVTPEMQVLFAYVWYDTAKNWHIIVKYLQIYWTDFGNIFTI